MVCDKTFVVVDFQNCSIFISVYSIFLIISERVVLSAIAIYMLPVAQGIGCAMQLAS